MDYYFSPSIEQERLTNEEITKSREIASKWKPCLNQPENYGYDIQNGLVFDVEFKKFLYLPIEETFNPKRYLKIWQTISSAMALYCLGSLYHVNVQLNGPDGFKNVWKIPLEHKESSFVVIFGDSKGAFTIYSKLSSHEDVPESAKRDLLELLNILANGKCPHPYDRVIAGSVA